MEFLGILPREIKFYAHTQKKTLHTNVHSSFSERRLTLEITWVSFSRCMVKQPWYIYIRDYYSVVTKNEILRFTTSRELCLCRKTHLQGFIFYDFIYETLLKWQHYRNGEHINDCRGLRRQWERIGRKWVWATCCILVVKEMFSILTVSLSISWLRYCITVL